jgi:hypothetical protein
MNEIVMLISQYSGVLGIPVVIALIELVKYVFPKLTKRAIPPIAILIGIGWLVLTTPGLTTQQYAAAGIIFGLSGSGLFSGTKALLGK